MYRGFYLRGKPDGRGEWTGDDGHTYAGDWRGGVKQGHGKETTSDFTYCGEFRRGLWHGKGLAVDSAGESSSEGTWMEGFHLSGVEITADGKVKHVDHEGEWEDLGDSW
jgi:hypothetical protein